MRYWAVSKRLCSGIVLSYLVLLRRYEYSAQTCVIELACVGEKTCVVFKQVRSPEARWPCAVDGGCERSINLTVVGRPFQDFFLFVSFLVFSFRLFFSFFF